MTAAPFKPGDNYSKYIKATSMLLLVAFPGLASIALVAYFFNVPLSAFTPSVNDEINYWHEILSFATHGFNSGYYTVEELTAAASFTPFGCHGPVYNMLYGTAAKLAGWNFASPPIFNIVLITASLVFLLALTKPDKSRLFLISAVIMTFWPILLYIPSVFQETFHFSCAIVLAAMVFHLYKKNETSSPALAIQGLLLLVLSIASLVRPTWSLLFPVILLGYRHKRTNMSTIIALTVGCVLTIIFHATYIWFSAPFPVGFAHNMILLGRTSISQATNYIASHFFTNLERMLFLKGDFVLETFQRWQAAALAITAFGILITRRIKTRLTGKTELSHEEDDYLFHIMNLGPVLLITLLLYELADLKDFRVIAPHILISLLLMALMGRRRLTLALVGSYIVLGFSFPVLYRYIHYKHFVYEANKNDPTDFRQQINAVSFNLNASRWDNSILIDVSDYRFFLTGLPAGIGINFVMDWTYLNSPIKSRYILIQPHLYNKVKNKANLKLISSGKFGNLYLNRGMPQR